MYENVEDLGEFWVANNRFGEGAMIEKFVPTLKARLALSLIEKWGMVACDAEHTRLLKPGEVVERACETADIAIDRMHELGWFTTMPAPQEKPHD